uniref:RRM domain-containing protein n=1 Tax=Schistosoma mansoni TaxID=6183 RepID=A0A5K4F435_SCHMA
MATITCFNTSGICSDLTEMNGDPHRIWLGCLPKCITEFSVLQLAKQFGELSDLYFPVHKTGDMQGSTVGYCFLTYRLVDDDMKAWKV